MSFPYIIKEESVTVVIDGSPSTVHKSNPHFQAVVDAITAQDWNKVRDNVSMAKAVKNYLSGAGSGNVEVRDGVVLYAGQPVNGVVVDRILAFMSKGLPTQPLINFLGRLMKNPSKRAVDELYTFLENEDLPILDDGRFVAYKGLNLNFTDKHTGTFNNKPGSILEMPRNGVDDNKDVGCSRGFHAGAWKYASDFAGGGPVVTVAIDPADVVSIPTDCSFQKLRTCKYEVLTVTTDSFKDPLYKTPAQLKAEQEAAQQQQADEGEDEDTEPDEVYCGNCGKLANEGDSYCTSCGEPLDV